MDANKLPRLFSKGNVAFVADDAEDSRGKAGGKCRLRGEVRGGYEWNYRSLEGDVGARRYYRIELELRPDPSLSTSGVIK